LAHQPVGTTPRDEPDHLVATAPQRLPLFALLAANAISLIGGTLTLVALPWFVLQTTGSAAQTGITAGFAALPNFLSGVFGGVLVDRLGGKRMSVIADLVSGLGIAAIPFFYLTVGLAFWQLLGLVLITELLAIPGLTARRAILPELAQRGGFRLEQVNSWFEGIQSLALLLGPPIAGLLIAWLGPSQVLWIDAATFAVSAAIVGLAIPGPGAAVMVAARRVRRRFWQELLAGWRFLRADRLLLGLAITLAITNFAGAPFYAVVLPVYAEDAYGRATALGLLISASGAGSLTGALLYGSFGHRFSRRLLFIGGFALADATWLALILPPSLPLVAALLAVGGLAAGPLNPLLVTVRHERIPDALRGRVFSTFSAITAIVSPIGMVITGAAIETIGLRSTVALLAGTSLCAVLSLSFIPVFHQLARAE